VNRPPGRWWTTARGAQLHANRKWANHISMSLGELPWRVQIPRCARSRSSDRGHVRSRTLAIVARRGSTAGRPHHRPPQSSQTTPVLETVGSGGARRDVAAVAARAHPMVRARTTRFRNPGLLVGDISKRLGLVSDVSRSGNDGDFSGSASRSRAAQCVPGDR